MRLLPALVHFVKYTSSMKGIDESHAIGHAMDVLHYSQEIIAAEYRKYPYLRDQEPIIYTSAIVHDMVDKKYTDPKEAVNTINTCLRHHLKPNEAVPYHLNTIASLGLHQD